MKPELIPESRIHSFVRSALGEDLHAKRVLSLGNAVVGTLTGAALAIHAIGLGLAKAGQRKPKHAVKQVDRLLSNQGVDVWSLFEHWIPFVIGTRAEIVLTLDWTEFDCDDHSTLALNMVTRHGRATPLMWLTVKKSELKEQRNAHEDKLLCRLKELVPVGVEICLLADRGFGDAKLYQLLQQLGFGFIIRFKNNIYVTDSSGETRHASDWLPKSGRATKFADAAVTSKKFKVGAVVMTHAAGMKEPWYLACSSRTMSARVAIAHYNKRFSTEENFRDVKDIKFGMGLSHTHIKREDRRDRLLLVSALSVALLTILGAAGEFIGIDAYFKVNTVKRRVHSLFRQGCMYYDFLTNMRSEWATPLLAEFERLMAEHRVFRQVFGVI